ncbi:MAG: RNA polymerase sigma factor [Bacteroidia bacterium]|nr:RNA polymerase sigma factor [Bacteroidia bacterium]NNC85940.1 RNA polymerase sigma factor [Bacteroidia bacterium]
MTDRDYNQCVDNYSDGLYRFILHNMRDEEEAKDVVQDTFEKMWVKHKDVDAKKAKSYLFTTGYHTMLDRIKKKKRSTPMETANYNMHSHTEQYSDASEVIRNAVNKLPEVQRSVIMLRDYEGYSYAEIADITNLTIAQVKIYIYRARVFLKEYLVSVNTVI